MSLGHLALIVAAGLAGPLLAAGRRAFVPVVVGEIVAGVILGRSGLIFGLRTCRPAALNGHNHVVIGIIGLLFKKQIEGTFTKNLWVIATMMVVVAIFLLIAEAVGKREREMQDLSLRDALAVGGAQVLSLIPGASRSGSTIMGGLFAGETRETAARFSFLLSIPAIAASGLLELKEAVHNLPKESYPSLAVATIISGIVGYASIWFLLRYLRTHSTGIFIGYRLIVGTGLLILLFTRVISPM